MAGAARATLKVRTAGLLSACVVGALWIDLHVLAPGTDEPSAEAAAPGGPLVVEVTVPGGSSQTTRGSAPPAPEEGGGGAPGPATPAPASSAASVPVAPVSAVRRPSSATAALTSKGPPPTSPPTSAPPSSPPPAAPTTSYRTASYEGVGDVVIADHGDGTIEFWSCAPAPGWAYQVENDGPTLVEVKFRRTSGEGEAKILITRRSDGSLAIEREG